MTTPKRDIKDVAAALRRAKARKEKATLLIGAGCSVTAGIPSASGIVKAIKTRYPSKYEQAIESTRKRTPNAVEPTYSDCMTALEPDIRRKLIRDYVDQAKINWAHMGIAALVNAGYADRLLTTNFDSLIARACAVYNHFPAVYDLTMSEIKRFKDLPDTAIFHLHGQRNGFEMLNGSEELQEHHPRVKPIFEHAGNGRVWIVCGYSGANDQLFELLKAQKPNVFALYWIGREEQPPEHLKSLFEQPDKQRCYYIQAEGADQFFHQLAIELEVFPPTFMHDPLSHMHKVLDQFAGFPLAGVDLVNYARRKTEWLQSPQSAEEATHEREIFKLLVQDRFEDAKKYAQQHGGSFIRSFLLCIEGCSFVRRAENSSHLHEQCELFKQAADKYQEASQLEPHDHTALNHWGVVLGMWARCKRGKAANGLFEEAIKKYDLALERKPDCHQALNNWGVALMELAKRSEGKEAEDSLLEALEKWLQAEKIRPGSAAYNMACIYGVLGQPEDCLKWLNISQKHGKLPSRSDIEKDFGLASMRAVPAFQAWLKTVVD